VVPEDAYTRDRVGFDALRDDDEVRSWNGGREDRRGVGAGEGDEADEAVGLDDEGAMIATAVL
jgi:hypothetical protein